VSRIKPPWVAAKKAEQARRQRVKERLMLTGIILLMIASMVVYGFYLKDFYFSKPAPSQKPSSAGSTSN
jgi:hypothetical protein